MIRCWVQWWLKLYAHPQKNSQIKSAGKSSEKEKFSPASLQYICGAGIDRYWRWWGAAVSVWRCSFEAGNSWWLSLQRTLGVLRDAPFPVSVDSGCSRCAGCGRTVSSCLGMFWRFGRRCGGGYGRDGWGGSRTALCVRRGRLGSGVDIVNFLMGLGHGRCCGCCSFRGPLGLLGALSPCQQGR